MAGSDEMKDENGALQRVARGSKVKVTTLFYPREIFKDDRKPTKKRTPDVWSQRKSKESPPQKKN